MTDQELANAYLDASIKAMDVMIKHAKIGPAATDELMDDLGDFATDEYDLQDKILDTFVERNGDPALIRRLKARDRTLKKIQKSWEKEWREESI